MLNADFHRFKILLLGCVCWTFAAAASQNPSLDDDLLQKLKTLYGTLAPAKITWVDSLSEDASTTGDQNASARMWDSASGVIIVESKGSLYLDTRPCTGHMFVFSGRYRKTKIGEVTCDGKRFDKYEVEKVQ